MFFSVIIPIYMVEPYLHKCIDSVLSQTYKDFELILVDDGSLDKCPEICDEYAKSDDRVSVIHKANGGLISARNAGILKARGSYICHLDADDWVDDSLLQTIADEAIIPYEPDLVVFQIWRYYQDHTVPIPCYMEAGFYDKQRLKEEIYPYLLYDRRRPFCKSIVFPTGCGKIYKRELLIEHYCRDERIRMGEDNAFVFECVYYAESMYVSDDAVYYYNQKNSSSITSQYDQRRFENNQMLYAYIEKRLAGKNNELDAQINAFKVYWLFMAVFHEVRSGRQMAASIVYIRQKIKETRVLKGLTMKDIPYSAKAYLLILKLRWYHLALLGAKILVKRQER